MSTDLFEQLAESEVPPAPETLECQVHQRVNRVLLLLHIVDFVVRGLPWTALRFGRAVAALLSFTLLGRFQEHSRERRD